MGFWIKLYTEVIDDYKYHQLPDLSKVLMYELFALAGRLDIDGRLPGSTEEIAFSLRRDNAFVAEHIRPLIQEKIITNTDGYTVTKFAERQAPIASTERSRYSRRNAHATTMQRNCNDDATQCNDDATNRHVDTDTDIDTDIDKKREDTDKSVGAENSRQPHPVILEIKKITGFYPKKDSWDFIIERFKDGSEAFYPELFEETYKAWVASGYSARNVLGMVDWYCKGIRSSKEARA